MMQQVVRLNPIVPDAMPPSRRWWVLATVVAAQFMFVVDAFVVNVAIPTIAVDLHASAAEIEAVVAIYLIGYATLVIAGGRLGDIYGTRTIFLLGVIGFAAMSLWCGLARSGVELILARLAQGAAAALMVPQVLAAIHVLFSDAARNRAFAIYGIVLGLGGAAGFVLGGLLVSLDIAGLGWRPVFFINIPVGGLIVAVAWRMMPSTLARRGVTLDLAGAGLLFAGLLGIIGPLLFGREAGWSPWLLAAVAVGIGIVIGFVRWERGVERRGELPLIDLELFKLTAFVRGLAATFCFFFGNLSFYFVTTLFLQRGLGFTPLASGLAVLPLALTFVVAARQSVSRAAVRGARVMTDGCALQLAGLVGFAVVVMEFDRPALAILMLPLALFGYGQGFVMAPLSSAVLATVAKRNAGAGSGLYGTATQIANAAGVAAIGGVFFTVQAVTSERTALLASLAVVAAAIIGCAMLLIRMRRGQGNIGVTGSESERSAA